MDTDEFRRIETHLAALEARHNEKLEIMQRQVAELRASHRQLDEGQREIVALLNRWRGAWPVITVLGALLAFLLTQWEKIKTVLTA